MKYLILAAFLVGPTCWAKEFKFTFNLRDGRQLKVKQEGDNRWKAMEEAGVTCGQFFGIGRKPLSENEAMDIIDSCANPSLE